MFKQLGNRAGSILLIVMLTASAAGRAVADPDADYAEGFKAYLEEDLISAMQYLESASQAGHADAQYLYGYILDKADENETAMRYYRMSADAGNADAMMAVGTMYVAGEGVEKDLGEAVRWFQMAAERGHNPALETLGAAYYEGDLGLDKDPAHGRMLLQKAADNGYENARIRLDAYEKAGAN